MFNTNITYFENNTDTIIFPSNGVNMEFHTQIEILDNKPKLMEDIGEDLFYKIYHAVRFVPTVKVLQKDLYKALWNKDDPRISRWYDNNKTSPVELYKQGLNV